MKYPHIICAAMLFACGGALAQSMTPPPIEISDPGPDASRIDQDGIFANYFPGKGQGSRPGVLLLAGSEGGLEFGTVRIAQALAAEGFSVLQLCYFGCPGLSPILGRVLK